MTINDIITKYYYQLKSMCHNDYMVISQSQTSEDILQNVCLTAIRKFKSQEIEEQAGLDYLTKTLYYELKFQPNRIDSHIIYTDDLQQFE